MTLVEILRNLATSVIGSAVADEAKPYVDQAKSAVRDMIPREPQRAITEGARMDDRGYPTMSEMLPAETAPYNRKGMGPVDPRTLQEMLKMAAESQQSVAGGTPYEPVQATDVMTPEEEARQAAYNPSQPIDYSDMDARLQQRFRENELARLGADRNRDNVHDFVRGYGDQGGATTAPYQRTNDGSAMFQPFRDGMAVDGNVAIAQRSKGLMQEVEEGADPRGAIALASVEKIKEQADNPPPPADPNDPNPPKSFFEQVGEGLQNFFGSEEKMLQLALAFNTLRYQPDQQLAAGIQKRLEQINESKDLSKTAASLERVGTPLAKKYAALIKANPTMAKEIYKQYLEEVAKGGLDFEDEQKLRKELQARPAAEQLAEMSLSFERIRKMAENPSPAGDLAMIFNFMKMLDPASVVRESEFRTAEQARAWLTKSEEAGFQIPSFVQQGIQRLQGVGTLLPEQRADFMNQSGNLYQGAYEQYQPEAERYTKMAGEYGMPAERIVREYEPYTKPTKYVVGYREGDWELVNVDAPWLGSSWRNVKTGEMGKDQ